MGRVGEPAGRAVRSVSLLGFSASAGRERLRQRRAGLAAGASRSRAIRAARSLARCRFTPRIIPTANTCSITPGPMRCIALAGAIIQSCNAPCRSRLCLAGAFLRASRAWSLRWRKAAIGLAQRADASSVHATFASEDAVRAFEAAGLPHPRRPAIPLVQPRLRDVRGFPRRSLLAKAQNHPPRTRARMRRRRISALRGDEITARDWDFFFRCYMDTGSRKWGSPYLNREFFALLAKRMADRCVLFVAERGRSAGRIRAQSHRRRGALRPLLGPRRRHPVPALRALLLPSHRTGDRTGPAARRSGRAGRTQARARLRSDADLQRTLDRAPGLRDAVAHYLAAETPAVVQEAEELAEHTPFKMRD